MTLAPPSGVKATITASDYLALKGPERSGMLEAGLLITDIGNDELVLLEGALPRDLLRKLALPMPVVQGDPNVVSVTSADPGFGSVERTLFILPTQPAILGLLSRPATNLSTEHVLVFEVRAIFTPWGAPATAEDPETVVFKGAFHPSPEAMVLSLGTNGRARAREIQGLPPEEAPKAPSPVAPTLPPSSRTHQPAEPGHQGRRAMRQQTLLPAAQRANSRNGGG